MQPMCPPAVSADRPALGEPAGRPAPELGIGAPPEAKHPHEQDYRFSQRQKYVTHLHLFIHSLHSLM